MRLFGSMARCHAERLDEMTELTQQERLIVKMSAGMSELRAENAKLRQVVEVVYSGPGRAGFTRLDEYEAHIRKLAHDVLLGGAK